MEPRELKIHGLVMLLLNIFVHKISTLKVLLGVHEMILQRRSVVIEITYKCLIRRDEVCPLNLGSTTINIKYLTGVGGSRQMFVDSNFPLEAPSPWDSAMGRSIVIFGPQRSSDRLACANIEPDHDIIKYVNLMKPPRFVL